MNDALLLSSLFILLTPPLLAGVLRKYNALIIFGAGLTFIYIVFTILTELLPETIEHLGYWTLIIPPLGLLVTAISEHKLLKSLSRMNHSLMLLILGLMFLHSLIDGASLYLATWHGVAEGGHHSPLGISLLLHRFVAVNVLWIALVPSFGKQKLSIFLSTIALGTLIGYKYSKLILDSINNGHYILEAFIIGSLLHFNIGIFRKKIHR